MMTKMKKALAWILTLALLMTTVFSATTVLAAEGTAGKSMIVDDFNGYVSFSGKWTPSGTMTGAYQNTVHYSNEIGAYTEFTFTGTGITIQASKENNRGVAEIFIDDVSAGKVDLYAATAQRNQAVFTKEGLANETHKVKIVVTGEKNADAKGAYVDIDAYLVHLDASAVVPEMIDDYSGSLTYSGTWTRGNFTDVARTGVAYLGTTAYGNTTNGYIEYTFYGTGVTYFASKGSNYGLAEVFIDGVSQGKVDLYSASTLRQQPVFSTDSLSAEQHTIKVVVTGEKNAASTAAYIDLDAFQIRSNGTGTWTETWDDQDAAVKYEGSSWSHNPNNGSHQNTFSYTKEIGASAEFTFTGNGITYIATKTSNRGLVEIFIDGESQGKVDLYDAGNRLQMAVFSAMDLKQGEHTIKVVVTGEKNAASKDVYIDVDAFQVRSTAYTAPAEPEFDISIVASDGVVTEADTAGRMNITWNANIQLEEAIEDINEQITCLGYGVYYGTSEAEIQKLIDGEETTLARKAAFAEEEDCDVYTIFGLRLKNVVENKSRAARFYFTYSYKGETYTVYSNCVTTQATLIR